MLVKVGKLESFLVIVKVIFKKKFNAKGIDRFCDHYGVECHTKDPCLNCIAF